MTKIIDFKNNISIDELNIIKNSFESGKLVIFPTETVYGIGANAYNENAVTNIFKAKNRASDNPLIVHVANNKMLEEISLDISIIERKLIDAFMPGPFTLILKKKNIIPNIVSANLDTIGIRIPENEIARKIIEYTNLPIAAPSANISSKPSGTNPTDIIDEFNNKVDIIIDGGQSQIGLESTVVKVINEIPVILRPGKITPNDIKKITGEVIIKDKVSNETIISPGLKYKHYAPTTKSILIYNENKQILKHMIKENVIGKTIIIGPEENKNYFKNVTYLSYGNNKDYNMIAHNIFRLLREADKLKQDLIIIEGVENEGLGIAIMNRLLRACEYNYITTKR